MHLWLKFLGWNDNYFRSTHSQKWLLCISSNAEQRLNFWNTPWHHPTKMATIFHSFSFPNFQLGKLQSRQFLHCLCVSNLKPSTFLTSIGKIYTHEHPTIQSLVILRPDSMSNWTVNTDIMTIESRWNRILLTPAWERHYTGFKNGVESSMLSCLLGCASPNCSGVEVPRPRVRVAAAAVGVQPHPPALPLLRRRHRDPTVHPICCPEGWTDEDEPGKS